MEDCLLIDIEDMLFHLTGYNINTQRISKFQIVFLLKFFYDTILFKVPMTKFILVLLKGA